MDVDNHQVDNLVAWIVSELPCLPLVRQSSAIALLRDRLQEQALPIWYELTQQRRPPQASFELEIDVDYETLLQLGAIVANGMDDTRVVDPTFPRPVWDHKAKHKSKWQALFPNPKEKERAGGWRKLNPNVAEKLEEGYTKCEETIKVEFGKHERQHDVSFKDMCIRMRKSAAGDMPIRRVPKDTVEGLPGPGSAAPASTAMSPLDDMEYKGGPWLPDYEVSVPSDVDINTIDPFSL